MTGTNAHTIAWQMLHTELRRRVSGDDQEVACFAALYEQARADGVSDLDIMAELAGFAATFAQMTRDPLGVAQAVARLAVQVPENGAGEQPEQPPVQVVQNTAGEHPASRITGLDGKTYPLQVDPELPERIRRLRGDGLTMREIARELGCSVGTVSRYA